MKYAWYIGLLLGVVPLQTTVLDAIGLDGIRPDLCLVVAVLVGFTVGPWEGLLLGLGLGFIQDFFSAGPHGLNLFTKGLSGLLAGIARRYVANASLLTAPLVVLGISVLSGTVFLLSGRGGTEPGEVIYAVSSIMVPQALLDALVALAALWVVEWYWQRTGEKARLISAVP